MPLAAVIRAIVADARALLEARLGLARAELSGRLRFAKYGAILLGAAAVLGLSLVITSLVTLTFILAEWLGLVLSLILVLLVFGALAAMLAIAGVRAFKQAFARPSPENPV